MNRRRAATSSKGHTFDDYLRAAVLFYDFCLSNKITHKYSVPDKDGAPYSRSAIRARYRRWRKAEYPELPALNSDTKGIGSAGTMLLLDLVQVYFHSFTYYNNSAQREMLDLAALRDFVQRDRTLTGRLLDCPVFKAKYDELVPPD
jgi:hypothetical protein